MNIRVREDANAFLLTYYDVEYTITFEKPFAPIVKNKKVIGTEITVIVNGGTIVNSRFKHTPNLGSIDSSVLRPDTYEIVIVALMVSIERVVKKHIDMVFFQRAIGGYKDGRD